MSLPGQLLVPACPRYAAMIPFVCCCWNIQLFDFYLFLWIVSLLVSLLDSLKVLWDLTIHLLTIKVRLVTTFASSIGKKSERQELPNVDHITSDFLLELYCAIDILLLILVGSKQPNHWLAKSALGVGAKQNKIADLITMWDASRILANNVDVSLLLLLLLLGFPIGCKSHR